MLVPQIAVVFFRCRRVFVRPSKGMSSRIIDGALTPGLLMTGVYFNTKNRRTTTETAIMAFSYIGAAIEGIRAFTSWSPSIHKQPLPSRGELHFDPHYWSGEEDDSEEGRPVKRHHRHHRHRRQRPPPPRRHRHEEEDEEPSTGHLRDVPPLPPRIANYRSYDMGGNRRR